MDDGIRAVKDPVHFYSVLDPDPDPVGSVSFGCIVKWEYGSGTDPGSKKTTKNVRILYFFLKLLFWLIYINDKLLNNIID